MSDVLRGGADGLHSRRRPFAAATLILASMGGADRSEGRRWIPLALAAKTVLDAVFGRLLTGDRRRRRSFPPPGD